jgi:hypothetical protein
MMEPLPLARSDVLAEVLASFVWLNFASAELTVLPMSKHRPLELAVEMDEGEVLSLLVYELGHVRPPLGSRSQGLRPRVSFDGIASLIVAPDRCSFTRRTWLCLSNRLLCLFQ